MKWMDDWVGNRARCFFQDCMQTISADLSTNIECEAIFFLSFLASMWTPHLALVVLYFPLIPFST